MKKIGFLSFGHWSEGRGSQVRSARDSLVQSVDLAVAAEEIGIDGAYFRIHHYAEQQASPFPLLATIAAKTTRLEFGTGVIDMRYENPLYLAEEAAATDILSGERLQLGVSRGSPEHADRGYRYFGYVPGEGQTDADMARGHTARFLSAIEGTGIADPNPLFGSGSGRLAITPHSSTLRQRIWWGAGNLDTAAWAAKQGMHVMSSTVIMDERGIPFEQLQLGQIEAFRAAWAEAGWGWKPQVSVSRSISVIVDERSRAYVGASRSAEGVGQIEGITSRFGPQFVGTPEDLVEQLRNDRALAAADSVLITVPNQLGVDFNVRQLAAVRAIGDELGWNTPAKIRQSA